MFSIALRFVPNRVPAAGRAGGLVAVALAAMSSAAHAHPGGHGHMSWLELVQHYAEPDHLAFLALTVIVGWLAYLWGRRIEARQRSTVRSRREDERP